MNPTDNQSNKTLAYSGVFLSCFLDLKERCVHAMPEHVLTYLYSGKQTIIDRDKKIVVEANQCAFIRRDHQIEMFKQDENGQPYKGITMSFNRDVLREVYYKMVKTKFPKNVVASDKKVLKVATTPEIMSLFKSITPYFDENIHPNERIVRAKLIEAIYALVEQSELFYPLLFDFADPWKIDILEFLNRNFMHDLTIEEFATYTGRSLATFKRDFKKISQLKNG